MHWRIEITNMHEHGATILPLKRKQYHYLTVKYIKEKKSVYLLRELNTQSGHYASKELLA